MRAITAAFLLLASVGCASHRHSEKTGDYLSDTFNHPVKFGENQYPSRYWHYQNFLVHFITNENEKNRGQTPIVYVHGLNGSVDDYSDIIPLLHHDRTSRPYYALDLPAFGRSLTYHADLSIRGDAILLGQFIDQLPSAKVNLVCHSMGGQICIEYALNNPERVQLLTLIDPAGVYQRSAYIKETLDYNVGISVGEVEHPHAKSIGDLAWYSQGFARRMITDNPIVLMAVESYRENYHDRIQQLQTKTLIIWGREDHVFGYENGLFLKENIANSTLYILEGADHFGLKTHAPRIADLIKKYL